jgi:dipeptidyl aminopeptidase/acylaminoacyl peptidase
MKYSLKLIFAFILGFSFLHSCNTNGQTNKTDVETITFKNRDAELHGIIAIPEGEGPFPAVVYVHGAGPEKRHTFYANYFAKHGVAFLTFDKRSYGESTGKFYAGSNVSYENLELKASDVCAGVEYLKNLPKINKKQIGLFGFSQAGWVAPLSASFDNEISYLVIVSGGVVTTGEELEYSSITGENPDFFEKHSQEQIEKIENNLTKSGYNPNPVMESINVKALWLFGNRDESIPVSISVNNLEKIKRNFKKDYTIKVFENRDHSLRLPDEKYGPPDFIHEIIINWINDNIKTGTNNCIKQIERDV